MSLCQVAIPIALASSYGADPTRLLSMSAELDLVDFLTGNAATQGKLKEEIDWADFGNATNDTKMHTVPIAENAPITSAPVPSASPAARDRPEDDVDIDDEWTPDFTSGLSSNRVGDDHNLSNLASHDDSDQWNSLRFESKSASSLNASNRVAPDSILWSIGKKVDLLGDRLYAASTDAIQALNAFDARHDLSGSVRRADARHGFTKRLDGLSADLTDKTDQIVNEIDRLKIKEKVAKHVKVGVEAAKAKMKKKSSTSRASTSASSSASSSHARRRSSQFISLGQNDFGDGAPTDVEENSSSDDDDEDDDDSPGATAASTDHRTGTNAKHARHKPGAASASSLPLEQTSGSSSSDSSNFSYHPTSRAHSQPNSLFQMPSIMRSNDDNGDDDDSSSSSPSDVESPGDDGEPHTLRSTHSNANVTVRDGAEASFDFGTRFADVPLSPDDVDDEADANRLLER